MRECGTTMVHSYLQSMGRSVQSIFMCGASFRNCTSWEQPCGHFTERRVHSSLSCRSVFLARYVSPHFTQMTGRSGHSDVSWLSRSRSWSSSTPQPQRQPTMRWLHSSAQCRSITFCGSSRPQPLRHGMRSMASPMVFFAAPTLRPCTYALMNPSMSVKALSRASAAASLPPSSLISMLAPRSTSRRTASDVPMSQATCRAVRPFRPRRLASAPRSRSACITCVRPNFAAHMSGV
mmetsp:Transcript_22050/g.67721  ORF Transcript_22050/g.67721 Transcript_22050/m.67721 type:complete len:235 (-) Transcript_22050:4466-5170(-)